MADKDLGENKGKGDEAKKKLAGDGEQAREQPKLAIAAESVDGNFAIVGVGASAGGLEAFSQLLRALPKEPGLALVFLQHISPQHESALVPLLSAITKLPVVEIQTHTAI